MRVKEAANASSQTRVIKPFEPKKIEKPEEKKAEKTEKLSEEELLWRAVILNEGIEKAAKIMHTDNSHPLSAPENAPIETFDEALKELRFVNSEKFKREAAKAQANIKIEDALYLFDE